MDKAATFSPALVFGFGVLVGMVVATCVEPGDPGVQAGDERRSHDATQLDWLTVAFPFPSSDDRFDELEAFLDDEFDEIPPRPLLPQGMARRRAASSSSRAKIQFDKDWNVVPPKSEWQTLLNIGGSALRAVREHMDDESLLRWVTKLGGRCSRIDVSRDNRRRMDTDAS